MRAVWEQTTGQAWTLEKKQWSGPGAKGRTHRSVCEDVGDNPDLRIPPNYERPRVRAEVLLPSQGRLTAIKIKVMDYC